VDLRRASFLFAPGLLVGRIDAAAVMLMSERASGLRLKGRRRVAADMLHCNVSAFRRLFDAVTQRATRQFSAWRDLDADAIQSPL
jgi:hypothetical protein